jgi:predicted GNAT family acetyltransferase
MTRVTDFGVLDNPIWFSAQTAHRSLVRINGRACRYADDVSPFAAVETATQAAFDDLAALVAPQDGMGFCTADPISVPPGWQVARLMPLTQMVCTEQRHAAAASFLTLGEPDVSEMLALTAATEPGPFLPATIRMGRYFGVREAGRLIAMAGERLQPDGLTEISAVCTDPDFRGRGYARALVRYLLQLIFADSRAPFLHVKPENEAAIKLYQALGFTIRRTMQLTLLARE